ncbi:hypothetical protein CAPTEDRAFT_220109, partial [Capitella teleta]
MLANERQPSDYVRQTRPLPAHHPECPHYAYHRRCQWIRPLLLLLGLLKLRVECCGMLYLQVQFIGFHCTQIPLSQFLKLTNHNILNKCLGF